MRKGSHAVITLPWRGQDPPKPQALPVASEARPKPKTRLITWQAATGTIGFHACAVAVILMVPGSPSRAPAKPVPEEFRPDIRIEMPPRDAEARRFPPKADPMKSDHPTPRPPFAPQPPVVSIEFPAPSLPPPTARATPVRRP